MQIYDFIMLAVLLGATVLGAWKGLAWQLASLASIFASYVVAVRFRDPVSQMIDATPPWNVFLAMLILYVASSLVIWILFRFVSAFIDRVRLKEFDRQFGALFGLAKGVLLCVVITLFAVTLLSDAQKQTVINSYSGFYIARLLDKADGVMPSELHEVLEPYLDRLDQELQPGAGGPRWTAEPPGGEPGWPSLGDALSWPPAAGNGSLLPSEGRSLLPAGGEPGLLPLPAGVWPDTGDRNAQQPPQPLPRGRY
ncbi:MAG: CvpA family protein [Pirellulaceae bacterium]|nr:CvpA family protein [Pirellulaceae bacterium]